MILIISLCKEKLHDLEFVKPIEKVVSSLGEKCSVKNYIEVAKTDLEKADKVLLSGTSLMDFDYFNHMDKFSWLKDCEKPVLGICAGMEIIVHEFGCTDLRELFPGFGPFSYKFFRFLFGKID